MVQPPSEVTRLLRDWSAGDPQALDKLMPLVLDEVRVLARRALALESPRATLQPTELVHEVYLRLVDRKSYWWQDRAQFFSSLAELMRRILVERARRHLAAKRGGNARKLTLDALDLRAPLPHPEIVALDDALDALSAVDSVRYRIVLLRFFVGLTEREIAGELGISINTVNRKWQAARKWLLRELSRAGVV